MVLQVPPPRGNEGSIYRRVRSSFLPHALPWRLRSSSRERCDFAHRNPYRSHLGHPVDVPCVPLLPQTSSHNCSAVPQSLLQEGRLPARVHHQSYSVGFYNHRWRLLCYLPVLMCSIHFIIVSLIMGFINS